MSLDFPERAKWLRYRHGPLGNTESVFHVSGQVYESKDPVTGVVTLKMRGVQYRTPGGIPPVKGRGKRARRAKAAARGKR